MAVEYGIITKELTEKELVKAISRQLNDFFQGKEKYDVFVNHNLMRHKNSGGISFHPEHIEWDYEYQYDYNNKYFGVGIELYPNTNEKGECKFHIDGVTWNLYVNEYVLSNQSGTYLWEGVPYEKHPAISVLVPFILEGIPCETVLIKEYEPEEERL